MHHFPGAQVEYRFKCRQSDVDLTPYVAEIRDEIRQLCALRFTPDELEYLRGWRFFKSDFVDLLGLFRLDERFIQVERIAGSDREIDITIRGPWLHTILFEVPVLAIVSEVYDRNVHPRPDLAEGRRRLAAKVARSTPSPIRNSGRELRHAPPVLARLARGGAAHAGPGIRFGFVGTSNVKFGQELRLPLGAMAHEYLQACQAVGPRLRDSQVFAFNMWSREYRGDLDIAFRRLRDGRIPAGLRPASLQALRRRAARFRRPVRMGREAHCPLPQDARSRTVVFSTASMAAAIVFEPVAGCTAFGIGITSERPLVRAAVDRHQDDPLQRRSRCEISDRQSEHGPDPSYVAYLREVFEVPGTRPAGGET